MHETTSCVRAKQALRIFFFFFTMHMKGPVAHVGVTSSFDRTKGYRQANGRKADRSLQFFASSTATHKTHQEGGAL